MLRFLTFEFVSYFEFGCGQRPRQEICGSLVGSLQSTIDNRQSANCRLRTEDCRLRIDDC
ncbi:hypothetical protein KsCSTR_18980 [Candidatus Kuenenia stuttgartiensis]|uniref:Uncharacterized protein n=1 Tax=Kuenenia stuttgartiensis TaxID=174633 RepID=Q1Q2E7_KUEST|nr:hypothetical protein KsCSTR_18980 [Candidatus Kuenenia stuttgartiensis]CAJ74183.1 unknown protein [Candidatus Kuenenia stuttgartiensis]